MKWSTVCYCNNGGIVFKIKPLQTQSIKKSCMCIIGLVVLNSYGSKHFICTYACVCAHSTYVH